MRRSNPLLFLGTTLAAAAVLGACAGEPVAPTAANLPGLKFHTLHPSCDFVTFGRLVVGDIVISGNAGGASDASFFGEIEIDVDGTKYHLSDIGEYGPPSVGPFVGEANARVIGGNTDNGEVVFLHVLDNGEPGADNDEVYLEIDGVVVVSGQTIDQGNIQFHDLCRGPDD